MTDVLTRVLTGLREQAELRGLDFDTPAEELCEALWLCQQGVPPLGDRTTAAQGAPPRDFSESRRRRPANGGTPAGREQGSADIYLDGQTSAGVQHTGMSEPVLSRPTWLPDAPALPHARDLARALRPLRYDPRRTYRTGDIDEDATARRIAQAGIRVPVWRTTRRRRLDLDLVLDLGGSGPLWEQLAAELRGMLEIHGAFRSVRFWMLDSDAADLPLRVGHLDPATTGDAGGVYPWDAVCPPPRRPIVVVLTDGTGRGWSTGQAYRPLRRWAGVGKVVLVQMLPPDMWNRTALRALPVTFHPGDDGYHGGARVDVDEADLFLAGLDHRSLPTATAIPVIGLDVPWLSAWLPLLRGAQAGAVPGYALLIPGSPAKTPAEKDEAEETSGGDARLGEPVAADSTGDLTGDLTGEQRVQRFLITSSGDAVRLARLLSVEPDGFNLNVMRKIKHELLRPARPPVMAEVMLGGLVYWTSPAGAITPPGTMRFAWYPGVRELLQERPYGEAEFERDRARVKEALKADYGNGHRYPAVLVGSGGDSVTLIPEGTEPIVTTFAAPVGAPAPARVAAKTATTSPDRSKDSPSEPADGTVRIGIWGSPTSGRTTYLTVLASSGWQRWGGQEEWRVSPANPETEEYLEKSRERLADKHFPRANLPTERQVRQLSFRLDSGPPEGTMRQRWRRSPKRPPITLELQDRGGGQWGTEHRKESANRYLAESDVLLYFFDPTYDDPYDAPKYHSLDFFEVVEAHLGMVAARDDTLYQGFLRQHVAVCIAKLDDQYVFDTARHYGCAESDPATGLPWVPSRHARRLFEKICQDQHRTEADFLLNRLQHSFHPDRISFHALSSIGFWIPEDGEFDPNDVCNVIEVPRPPDDISPPERRVRGPIRPLHVLDPVISLVERTERDS